MKSRTAEKTVELLMTRFNKNPESLVFSRLADEYRKDGNFLKAIEICTSGLHAHPGYVTGRIVLSLCYIEQGNYPAAIQELISILSQDRRNQNAMKMLADLYNRQGKTSVAGDLYNLINIMDPGNKSVELVAKQFQFSGETDIYSILGLTLPEAALPPANRGFDSAPQDMNKTFVESEHTSFEDAQTMSISNDFDAQFGLNDEQNRSISPDEIGSRMDELFGDSSSGIPDQSEEIINDDNMMSEELGVNDQISGDDISNRMNALFSEDATVNTGEEITSDNLLSNPDDSGIVSGDDFSMKLGMLDGTIPLENDSDDLQIEHLSGDVGAEVNEQIDSIFGSDENTLTPDFGASLSLDIPDSQEELLTGKDLDDHFDKIMPDLKDDMIPNMSNETLLQEAPESSVADENGITGNDFMAHMDSITGEKSSDENMPGIELDASEISSDSDLLIDNEDPLQGISPEDGTISLKEPDELILDNMSGYMGNDEEIASTPEQFDRLATDTDTPEHAGAPATSAGISGDDFSDHLDMIFGSKDKSEGQTIYDKISNDYDTESRNELQNPDSTVSDTGLCGDDVSDRIDLLNPDFKESDVSQKGIAGALPEGNERDNESGNVLPDVLYNNQSGSGEFAQNTDNDVSIPDNGMISPFINTEFEETMQIDRSFIESVQLDGKTDIPESAIPEEKEADDNKEDESLTVSLNGLSGFDIENETIQMDKSELDLFSVNQKESLPDNAPEKEFDDLDLNGINDLLTIDLDNPVSEQSEEINTEVDERELSEMDILTSESASMQGVTGQDVIEKMDELFPFAESVGNEADIIENSSLPDMHPENGTDEPLAEENDNTVINLQKGLSDTQMLSGNDVENRMDELFNNASVDSVNKNYQNAEEELEIEDVLNGTDSSFNLNELENEIEISDEQKVSFQDESDQLMFATDEIHESASSDQEKEEEIQTAGKESDSSSNEPDEKVKSYSIPDHVLTPTLADIYFQQGQYQLALQIYSRLLEKNPDSILIQERLEEIRQQILTNENVQTSQQSATASQSESLESGTVSTKSVKSRKKTVDSEKPLAGVRIRKNKKSSKK